VDVTVAEFEKIVGVIVTELESVIVTEPVADGPIVMVKLFVIETDGEEVFVTAALRVRLIETVTEGVKLDDALTDTEGVTDGEPETD